MLLHQTGNLCLVISKAQDMPFIIKIAGLVIMVAICMILFTLIAINYNRNKRYEERDEANEAEALILTELNEHILQYDSITDMPENELQQSVSKLNAIKNRSAISRQVLVNLLVYFRHNLTGNITRVITSVYYRLNLSQTTLSKLKSMFWFTKAQGLKEMQEIHNSQSADSILELVKDEHVEVRVEAYSALLKLNQKNTFSFFSNEKDELSEWHQILLFDAITKAQISEIPDFKIYLT